MGKAEENKQHKRLSLLNTAFELFTTKGVNKTSISEISEQAGIAKGTFYPTLDMIVRVADSIGLEVEITLKEKKNQLK